jgi:mannose-6-phosphate isomerase-like protein (cupin superfamily)
MRIAGCWAEITMVSLFQARPDREVELHYHDGHEYWIFFRGRGRGCSEGVEDGLEPGAMIATAMGHEHAPPRTDEIVEAVALETGLCGPKRRGHLHREVHGVPIPAQQ